MADSRSISERLSKLPPGRHLIPRDFVFQNQRERMLLATAELVAERGYQKTTIELIAKTARVALTTFYEQFASKEECFLAAFDESVEAAGQAFAELLDPERPWVDQVSSGLEVFLEMVVVEPARAKLCLVESQAAGAAALARYQGMLEKVAPKLREGRELNPRTSRLPEGLEVAIAGGLAWLVHQRLVAGRSDELKALLPEMLQVTLTPYVGEADAARAAETAQARAAA
ncbi:MAG TPA: TetR/AcrR family transcriptional regulator [Solirubrobacterales bacterium]|jgi:AcrR family transcriptional regulator|nr:TetR/AcrR family transcriptional regulator [Solirubrobacterales bacterium]